MKNKIWKPEINRKYWYIETIDTTIINSDKYGGDYLWHRCRFIMGNMFRTKKEAQAKLKQIKKILKER